MLSKSKCTRRWENSKHTKYKHIFPSKSHKKLTLRAILLRNNSRKVNSKIARRKTGHSMLKGHKSKIDTETSPKCSTYKVKETPTILFLNCKEFDKKWAKLVKDIMKMFCKNNCHKLSITKEDLLGKLFVPRGFFTYIGKMWAIYRT